LDSARRARARYIAGLTRSLKQYEATNKDIAALATAHKILDMDSTSRDANRVVESISLNVQKTVLAKAKKKRKALPHIKRAESALKKFVTDTHRRLKLAQIKKDPFGTLQCTRSLLALDAADKDALKAQAEARTMIIKTAQVLGRALKEEDLAWYKIEGKYSFDGDLVAFNSGVLGVGPMAKDIVITCEVKARGLKFKFGWGVQKTWGSGGADQYPGFDGRQWVRLTIASMRHVGFWQVDDTPYRSADANHFGRLIIYPGGQTELRGVRIYKLK